MCVSTLLVALTGLIATATAIDQPPPSTEVAEEDRRVLKKTEAEKAERSSIFAKLGFCNTKTLRGRYTFASNGNADVSSVFVSDVFPPEPVSQDLVGPVASSGSSYFDGKGKGFTRIVSRPDKLTGSLGAPVVLNVWTDYEIAKNCSSLQRGTVLQYTSPDVLILPGSSFLIEGDVAPDGKDNVFTTFDLGRILAFSGDAKQVAKFAVAPEEFDNPPDIPDCNADQSCFNKFNGDFCTDDSDCRTFCFPLCGMVCQRQGLFKKCVGE